MYVLTLCCAEPPSPFCFLLWWEERGGAAETQGWLSAVFAVWTAWLRNLGVAFAV